MEVRIGVIHTAKELTFETDAEPDDSGAEPDEKDA